MEKTIGLSVYATIDFGKANEFVKTYPLEKVFNEWMNKTLELGDYNKLGKMFEEATGLKVPEFFTVAVADKTSNAELKEESKKAQKVGKSK